MKSCRFATMELYQIG